MPPSFFPAPFFALSTKVSTHNGSNRTSDDLVDARYSVQRPSAWCCGDHGYPNQAALAVSLTPILPRSQNRQAVCRSDSEQAKAEPDSSLPRNGKPTKSPSTPLPPGKQGLAEQTSNGQTFVLGTALKSQLDQPASYPASGPAPSTRTCAGGTAWLSSLLSCVQRNIPRPIPCGRLLRLVIPVQQASNSSTSMRIAHRSINARHGCSTWVGCGRIQRDCTIGW